jgi:fluoride exporter
VTAFYFAKSAYCGLANSIPSLHQAAICAFRSPLPQLLINPRAVVAIRYNGRHLRGQPMKVLLIAGGGAIGSVLRYWLAALTQRHLGSLTASWFGHALPLGTLAVNLIGCLLIGALAALFVRHELPHEQYRLALTVGVLGGFTTFSAFGLDTFVLLQRGHIWLALFNVVASCVAGVGAVAIGFYGTERLLGP